MPCAHAEICVSRRVNWWNQVYGIASYQNNPPGAMNIRLCELWPFKNRDIFVILKHNRKLMTHFRFFCLKFVINITYPSFEQSFNDIERNKLFSSWQRIVVQKIPTVTNKVPKLSAMFLCKSLNGHNSVSFEARELRLVALESHEAQQSKNGIKT